MPSTLLFSIVECTSVVIEVDFDSSKTSRAFLTPAAAIPFFVCLVKKNLYDSIYRAA